MPPRPAAEPHRGVLILVLGILGIVVCWILAPVAWVMGNRDLEAMALGRMDPSGRDQTNIGRVLGIIGTCLIALWLILLIAAFGFGMLGAILEQ